MSFALSTYLQKLEIESLEIDSPVLDNYHELKFKALYEAISRSNVKHLKMTPIMKRDDVGDFQRAVLFDYPLGGIQDLLNSNITSLYLTFKLSSNFPQSLIILDAIPVNLRKLQVIYRSLII